MQIDNDELQSTFSEPSLRSNSISGNESSVSIPSDTREQSTIKQLYEQIPADHPDLLIQKINEDKSKNKANEDDVNDSQHEQNRSQKQLQTVKIFYMLSIT